MKQSELIKAIGQYFDVRELVSKAVWDKHGTGAWRFFDPRLLETLLVLRRDILRVPLVCNNWKSGGTLQQRGLRENTCATVKAKTSANALYLSAHTLGMAADLSSGRMTADEMRRAIEQNKDKLPHNVRIEDGASAPTWLHIDVATDYGQSGRIVTFK